jgi:hypothetical protein
MEEKNEQKPTIDERLAALAQSVELLSVNVHAMQEDTRKWEAEQKRLGERERRARHAILSGIATYFQTLNEGDDETTQA